jgi:site-specific DNA-methyltransferase (adenine-specific)/adenine-specific DNA-methyltransferase
MPTLNWIGKAAVVEHHKEVPFRLLKCQDDLSVGDAQAGNLLVQGDNLEALKALLPYYAGQVKCIYIDPPYNTGNESWVYNDAMNSPEMKDWLGKVVGGEAEDLSRHDKWLCMMYPRLALLHQMLREDGSLWMSIDDNEVHNARAIMDEIFGVQNFVTTIIWEKLYSPKSSARHFSANHDYVIVYAKNARGWERNLLSRTEEQDKRYKNPDNDPRGIWKPGGLDARNYYSLGTYSITTPSGRVISGPPNGAYWRVSKDKLEEMDKDGRIWWGETGNNVPSIKRFLSEVRQGIVPETIWPYSEVGHTQEAKQEIVKILQDAFQVFTTPKPTRLIQRIIQLSTNKDDLVLDSFAGSGTTGHAVLKQNVEDSGNRRFILVEMDTNIAPNITAERLKRVVQGYTYSDQKGHEKTEAGLGGGFRFCELGATLFDPTGQIRPEVKYEDLAQHIHFIETGSPLPRVEKPQYPLLGVHNGLAIYLLYNGVLKDKSPHGGNVLTYELLESLPPHDGMKVIYGNGCRIGEQRLRDLGIVFKQIPYEIRER